MLKLKNGKRRIHRFERGACVLCGQPRNRDLGGRCAPIRESLAKWRQDNARRDRDEDKDVPGVARVGR